MIKFPSIEQFRNIIKELRMNHDYKGKSESDEPVYVHDSPYPKLTFKGTVKLHGTNAGIVLHKNGNITYQSRGRDLSLQHDNMKFMLSMSNKDLMPLFENIEFKETIAIFGEWCGKGIQSGVGISQIDPIFVIFACKVDDQWIEYNKDSITFATGIYNINNFKTWEIEIDFEQPELIQNYLEEQTLAVEEECPVAKQFGIQGVGEGIVWTCDYNGHHYTFKTKGDKHSSSKVIKVANINIEQIENINKFVDFVLTTNRLKQGVDYLKEMELEVHQKSTSHYLKWIVNDVLKEENDTIVKNQLDVNKVCSELSRKARLWFFNNLE